MPMNKVQSLFAFMTDAEIKAVYDALLKLPEAYGEAEGHDLKVTVPSALEEYATSDKDSGSVDSWVDLYTPKIDAGDITPVVFNVSEVTEDTKAVYEWLTGGVSEAIASPRTKVSVAIDNEGYRVDPVEDNPDYAERVQVIDTFTNIANQLVRQIKASQFHLYDTGFKRGLEDACNPGTHTYEIDITAKPAFSLSHALRSLAQRTRELWHDDSGSLDLAALARLYEKA